MASPSTQCEWSGNEEGETDSSDSEECDRESVTDDNEPGSESGTMVVYNQSSKMTPFTTAVETVETREGRVRDVHFHLHNPSTVALGHTVINMEPPKTKKKGVSAPQTKLQKLRSESYQRVMKWTEGMVETKSSKVIQEKVLQGKTVVTITGSPGEGKTTSGYLVLKRFHDMGKDVFDISTPEEYFTAKDAKSGIVMINDIFGSTNYDFEKRWRDVITDTLAMDEHRAESRDKYRGRGPKFSILLISRSTILKEASSHLGRFKDFIINEGNVVDITRDVKSPTEERMRIWRHYADQFKIQVDDKTVKEVCEIDLPHGFPHCCRLFASMFKDDTSTNMKEFFQRPIEFLNLTIESLLTDMFAGSLLRRMLKCKGKVCLDDIDCDDERYRFSEVVDRLEGTYLAKDKDEVYFHHPSVYDSVAFIVCKRDPKFVIQNCSLKFLNERVIFEGTTYKESLTHGRKMVTVSRKYTLMFLSRLKQELLNGYIGDTLLQYAFHDEEFTSIFMENIQTVSPSQTLADILNLKSFLFLSTSSKSVSILKYICDNTKLNAREVHEALCGVCHHVCVEGLQLLKEQYDLDVNAQNSNQTTPFLMCASRSSEEMLNLLLQYGADTNSVDKSGNSALHLVCRHGTDGDGSIVQKLVEAGLNPRQQSLEYPRMPLNIAAFEGHVSIVAALLNLGLDVNEVNRFGCTALHEATWMGYIDLVQFLIRGGANVNQPNGDGFYRCTPLHNAAARGHLEIVDVFLRHGADVNAKTRNHETALNGPCRMGYLEIVKLLVNKGCDVNGSSGITPLHDASWNGHVEIVDFLLKNNAEINRTNGEGYGNVTPLYDACSQGKADVVKLLLRNGADIHSKNSSERLPLHIACRKGYTEVVKLLLDNGSSVKAGNDNDVTPLHHACWNGYAAIAELLIGKGADVNQANSLGYTPLHDACLMGHQEIVSILLKNRADVNAMDVKGNMPLNLASRTSNTEIVRLLLDKWSDVRAVNQSGVTALHDAAWTGQTDIVKLLVDRGADVNAQNGQEDGFQTPLHDACSQGHEHVVQTLLGNGADPAIKNSEGHTPLDIARKRNFGKICSNFV